MNEFIKEGTNGYLCRPNIVKYPDISISVAEIDPRDLKVKMENMMNRTLHPLLCRNSRHIAEELYDLEKNKKYFKDLLEKYL